MTFDDIEGLSPIARFPRGVFRTVVQSLTRSQLAWHARAVPRRQLSRLSNQIAIAAFFFFRCLNQCWQ